MLQKLKWVLKLGVLNLARVGSYRFLLKIGFFKIINPIHAPVTENFITSLNEQYKGNPPAVSWLAFGHIKQSYLSPPDWHKSVINKKQHPQPEQHWSDILDFSPDLGDIKGIWENSRWDWLWLLASQHDALEISKEDAKYVANTWLLDWSRHNPANQGPNWKCGQEASIRVIHFALAWHLFGESQKASGACVKLISEHLQRISPTIHYAVGQDNNHGTSEAAALYIGGSWLKLIADYQSDSKLLRKGKRWERLGRKWLHNRVGRLIENDGGFSQYSVNYHRLMLDTLSVCELWRRLWDFEHFSSIYYKKMELACSWLMNLTDPDNGLAPNLGHNDGANLLPLYQLDYNDFRSSVNFCYGLLKAEHVYENLETRALLSIFDLKTSKAQKTASSYLYKHTGYALLKNDQSSLLFNLPVFKFRPSQNDAFHVDLFLNHENVLRDAGSFSYAVNDDVWNQFSGVAGHNTVQFDDRQQMPRISRFLSAEWLSCVFEQDITVNNDIQTFSASYIDWCGARHSRLVELSSNHLRVVDSLSGSYQKAVLRWRLCPGDWNIGTNLASLGKLMLSISSSHEIKRFEVIKGLESRYYAQTQEVPVLEIEVYKQEHSKSTQTPENRVCELITQISW